jgi:hypothetical protein
MYLMTLPGLLSQGRGTAGGILTVFRQADLKTLGNVERRWVWVFRNGIGRRGDVFFISLDEGVSQVFHDVFQCNVFVVVFWAWVYEDWLSDLGKLGCGWCGWDT